MLNNQQRGFVSLFELSRTSSQYSNQAMSSLLRANQVSHSIANLNLLNGSNDHLNNAQPSADSHQDLSSVLGQYQNFHHRHCYDFGHSNHLSNIHSPTKHNSNLFNSSQRSHSLININQDCYHNQLFNDNQPQHFPLLLSEALKEKGSCKVCGEKAFYQFYGTLACDSCRTFFRRHVLQNKALSCDFNGDCEVTATTRKECSKCRMNKCLEAGMRIELVAPNEEQRIRRGRATDFDKLASRARVLSKDKKSNHTPRTVPPPEVNNNDSPPRARSPESPDDPEVKFVTSRLNPFLTNYQNRQAAFAAAAAYLFEGQPLQSLSQSSPSLATTRAGQNSIDYLALHKPCSLPVGSNELARYAAKRAASVAMASHGQSTTSGLNLTSPAKVTMQLAETQAISSFFAAQKFANEECRSPLTFSAEDLSVSDSLTEKELISEILQAAHQFQLRSFEIVSNKKQEIILAAKLLYFGIERVVSACRYLSPYKALIASDQGALLKGGCSEMLLLRSTYHADLEADAWLLSSRTDGRANSTQLSIKVLSKIREGESAIYANYRNFVKSMGERWRKDNVVLTLMMAIVLFSPNRPDCIDRDAIKRTQRLYARLLKRYLESIEGHEAANMIYDRLNSSLDILKRLREDYDMATVDLSEAEVNLLHSYFSDLSLVE